MSTLFWIDVLGYEDDEERIELGLILALLPTVIPLLMQGLVHTKED